MQEQFKKSFCGSNNPCGSTRCVDIYRDGPDGSWPASNDDDDDDDDDDDEGAWPASNDGDDDGAWPASNDDDDDDAWPASNDDDRDHHVSTHVCIQVILTR